MKKFIVIICTIILCVLILDTTYYRLGFYIDFKPNKKVTTFMKTDDKKIQMNTGDGYRDFEIKSVNLGSAQPGNWATEHAISEDTYLRWFNYIKEMGANTIRVYTVQSEKFYKAFYKYNKNNHDPLYLIHGVWVDDYIQNSTVDAYDKRFFDEFIKDCKTVVDVIHGAKRITNSEHAGNGKFSYDISSWVIGYIIGVEWEDVTVEYTNQQHKDSNAYSGKYIYTSDNASPFEAMLAEVGDKIIEYESKKYKEQRLLAFSNWPTTDPFEYPQHIKEYFMKCAKVDVENIKTTDKFLAGQFASYHVYPYYPDYLAYMEDITELNGIDNADAFMENEKINTYRAYLTMLNSHHTMPVVISEFGVPTSRGVAQYDINTGRHQGKLSEQQQGQAIVKCYEDIMQSGCAGSSVFSWQDEWFKRTWNTMYAIDLKRTAYWSDYQTNEQNFGLLSFDPGKEKSICYVDGDISEWKEKDVVSKGETTLSMKYDEKFIYFLVKKDNLDFDNDVIYIPIDTTEKSGSNYCSEYNLKFQRNSDFLIVLNGKENSRVLVQERYESLMANYSYEVTGKDAYVNPSKADSNVFKKINMILQTATPLLTKDVTALSEVFETGKLTYGNANPNSDDFNSLSDFICKGDYIEIKIPWQMLNFSDPSRMAIHDDYYENYGVKNQSISQIYVGAKAVSDNIDRIPMESFKLSGWGNKVTYHERLKKSYYILKERWNRRN